MTQTTPSTSAQVLNVADRMREFMEGASHGFAKVPVAHIAEWRKLISDLASPSPAASAASPSGVREIAEQIVFLVVNDDDHAHVRDKWRPEIEAAEKMIASLASAATPAPTSGSEDGGDPCMWDQDKPCTCGGADCEQVDFGQGLAKPASEPAGVDVREAVEQVRYHWEIIQGQCSEGDGFTERAATDLELSIVALEAALSSSAGPAEPVAYASAEQIAELVVDRPGDGGGAYIPLRKTPAGLFQMALYAHPAPATVEMREAARAAVERLANVQMNISLAEWSDLSNAILSALASDATPAPTRGPEEAGNV